MLLGVDRGAFRYETERLGVPLEEKASFLTREEISSDGFFYKFACLTIMPSPVHPGNRPIRMAVINSKGNYNKTKLGCLFQTIPLAGSHQLLLDQVNAFNRA